MTDDNTVEALQLKVPGLSKYDAELIRNQMLSGKLFPEIRHPLARQQITSRLLAIEHRIPSIFSLFKDIRYLQPAVQMIKSLLPNISKGTLREALRFHFSGANSTTIEIQTSEHKYSSFAGTPKSLFDLAIRQLFLCAIRISARPLQQRESVYSSVVLAELARRLGFSSESIEAISKHDPYQLMALDLVDRILPNKKPADLLIRVQPLAKNLKDLVIGLGTSSALRPVPFITVATLGEPVSRRCGILAWTSTKEGINQASDDVDNMFINQMHCPLT